MHSIFSTCLVAFALVACAQSVTAADSQPASGAIGMQIVLRESAQTRARREAVIKQLGRIPATYSVNFENLAEEILVDSSGDATIVHH